jgi:hypothetical protein
MIENDYSCRVDISYHGSRGKCLRTSSVFADPDLLETIKYHANPDRKNGRVKTVLVTVTYRRQWTTENGPRMEYEYAYHYSWQR